MRQARHHAVRTRTVIVNDKMQRGYRYTLTAPSGRNFDPEFRPELTPAEMLRLGVFGGKYLTDCKAEFPRSWLSRAKLADDGRDCSLNYFGVDASQPLSVWRKKGWIHRDDPRGWFQWYCRYYLGRRSPQEDARQIRRWNAIRRHVRQIQRNCEPGDVTLPAKTAAGAAALGLRQPQDLNGRVNGDTRRPVIAALWRKRHKRFSWSRPTLAAWKSEP
jgi:hypothetical protein